MCESIEYPGKGRIEHREDLMSQTITLRAYRPLCLFKRLSKLELFTTGTQVFVEHNPISFFLSAPAISAVELVVSANLH